jgi:D-serine deaminase-like pyridoxal phosphate-dependent protein
VDHLEGVDEARPGVYLFQDIHQAALGSCSLDQIALTVLTTVIGKRPEANLLLVDAGGLALSKDRSTAGMGASDGGFGLVRDLDGQLIEGARITSVCQEHGFLQLPPHLSVDSFPAGTLFRILPNHACMTAAAHDSYRVVQGGALRDSWRRINFWHGCPSR